MTYVGKVGELVLPRTTSCNENMTDNKNNSEITFLANKNTVIKPEILRISGDFITRKNV
jgi:hypothetical protein